MTNLLKILILLLIALPVSGQPLARYKKAMNSGDISFEKMNYDAALKSYQDAQIAAREGGLSLNIPQEKIREVFNAIQEQKKKAEEQTRKSQSLALSSQAMYEIYVNHDITKGFKYAEYALNKDPENASAKKAIFQCVIHQPGQLFYEYSLSPEFQVCNAIYSPDGTKIAIACSAGPAIIVDAKTGKTLFVLDEHFDPHGMRHANSLIVFSPDGKTIFTAFDGYIGKKWDCATGNLLDSVKGNFAKAFYIHEGKKLVTVSGYFRNHTAGGGHSNLYDAATFKKIRTLHSNLYFEDYPPQISPDESSILVSSQNVIKICNSHTGDDQYSFFNRENKYGDIERNKTSNVCVSGALFSQDGKRVIALLKDKIKSDTLKVWNAENGKLIIAKEIRRTIPGKAHSETLPMKLSDDGKLIYTLSALNDSDEAGQITAYDSENLELVETQTEEKKSMHPNKDSKIAVSSELLSPLLHSGINKPIISAQLSPNKQSILTVSSDNTVRIWQLNQKSNSAMESTDPVDLKNIQPELNSNLRTDLHSTIMGFEVQLISHNNRYAITNTNNCITLWNATQRRKIKSFNNIENILEFSPDDNILLLTNKANELLIINTDNGDVAGKLATGFEGNSNIINANISPDSKYLVYNNKDEEYILYHIKHNEPLTIIPTKISSDSDQDKTIKIAFTRDSRKIVIGYEGNEYPTPTLSVKSTQYIDPNDIIRNFKSRIRIPDLSKDEKEKYNLDH